MEKTALSSTPAIVTNWHTTSTSSWLNQPCVHRWAKRVCKLLPNMIVSGCSISGRRSIGVLLMNLLKLKSVKRVLEWGMSDPKEETRASVRYSEEDGGRSHLTLDCPQ